MELEEGGGVVLGGVGREVGDDDIHSFCWVFGYQQFIIRDYSVHCGLVMGDVLDQAGVILLDFVEM